MSTKNKYVCKYCGKEYFSYKENSNYCSHECRIKDNEHFHNCDYCGKEFKINNSKYKKYMNGEIKHLYCSKECANKGLITSATKTCKECGKEFTIFNCFKDIQIFCSRECYEKSRKRKQQVCPICQKIYIPNRKGQKYCSNECKAVANMDRTECTCEYCGKRFERKKSEVEKNKRHFCSEECKYNAIRWKVEDIETLREKYGSIKNDDLARLLIGEHSGKAVSRKARELGLARDLKWTEEETSILINTYETMPFFEVQNRLPNRSPASIMGKAKACNLLSYFYRNRVYSEEELSFMRNNYLLMANEEIAKELNRTPAAVGQKLRILGYVRPTEGKKGVGCYRNLADFVRSRLRLWRKEVLEYYNNTCSVTGSKENIIVHHIRSFNLIFNEVIDILNFPEYDNFEDYTQNELMQFVECFLNLQDYYHEYTCITESVHILFHKNYGYGDNTSEQWGDFINKYQNGYFETE